MIPESFFSEIGHKSPFLIDKGRLFQLYYEPRKDRNEIVVRFPELALYGLPSIKLEQLEQDYMKKHEPAVIALQQRFVQKVIKEAEIYSEEKLRETISRFETAEYIINNIMPNFQETEADILNTLKKEKTVREDNLLEKMISSEYRHKDLTDSEFSTLREKLMLEAEEMINPEASAKRKRSIVQESPRETHQIPDGEEEAIKVLLRGKTPQPKVERPIAPVITREELKKYDSMDDILKGRILCVLGNVYVGDKNSLKFFDTLDNFDQAYRNKIERAKIIESIDTYENQIKKTGSIKAKIQALNNVLSKGAIELGDVGFIIKSGTQQHYVYLKVPQYALKDPNQTNAYYLFPPCRVAVAVSKRGGSIDYAGPLVIENYDHPFISRNSGEWASICMGHYTHRGRDSTERIINLLSDGRNVIQKGYIQGSNPYRRLHDDSGLARLRVDKSELDRREIPVTNVWR